MRLGEVGSDVTPKPKLDPIDNATDSLRTKLKQTSVEFVRIYEHETVPPKVAVEVYEPTAEKAIRGLLTESKWEGFSVDIVVKDRPLDSKTIGTVATLLGSRRSKGNTEQIAHQLGVDKGLVARVKPGEIQKLAEQLAGLPTVREVVEAALGNAQAVTPQAYAKLEADFKEGNWDVASILNALTDGFSDATITKTRADQLHRALEKMRTPAQVIKQAYDQGTTRNSDFFT